MLSGAASCPLLTCLSPSETPGTTLTSPKTPKPAERPVGWREDFLLPEPRWRLGTAAADLGPRPGKDGGLAMAGLRGYAVTPESCGPGFPGPQTGKLPPAPRVRGAVQLLPWEIPGGQRAELLLREQDGGQRLPVHLSQGRPVTRLRSPGSSTEAGASAW